MSLKQTNLLILISFFPVFIFRSNLNLIEIIFSLVIFLMPIALFNFFFLKKLAPDNFFFTIYLSAIIVFGIDNNLGLWNGLILPLKYFLQNISDIIYFPGIIIFIILILITYFIILKTNNKFYNVILVFLFTIFIFNVLDLTKSHNKLSNFTNESNKIYNKTKVIIIFDEMSGVNSLASSKKNGVEFVELLKKFYKKNNFEYYSEAKSNSDNSATSISSLLNFNKKDRLEVIETSPNYFFEYNLTKSLLFKKFNNISIFQSIHINYCNVENITKCDSYNPFNQKKFLKGYKDNILTKIISIWKINGSISSILTWRTLRQFRIIDSVLEPEGHKATFQSLFDKIESDIYSNKYDLIFAHTLVPHKPYGFNKNCNYDGGLSLLNNFYTTEEHLIQHNIERKCVIIYLEKFLNKLKVNNKIDFIDLIILSDHGSRITRDANSSLTTMLAVKNSKTVYKEIKEKIIIQEFISSLVN